MSNIDQNQVKVLFDKLPFFRFFTVEEKTQLADHKHHILGFKHGQAIIRQGERDSSLFLLLRGEASVTRKERGAVRLNTLKPGSIFGEVAFLVKRERTTNVIADTDDVVVLKMDWDMVKAMSPSIRSKIKDQLIEVLINRLDSMNMVLVNHIR